MKIIILNGSPKGKLSVTMQYIEFIRNKFKEHEFEILNISQQIKRLEKNEEAFQEILDKVQSADGIIWGAPVYHLLVPSQYKRFIELIFERGKESYFENKFTAVFTTSIHFFDHTAHNYMHAICDDLNMKYIGFYSADMYDLMKKEERERILLFSENFFNSIHSNLYTSKAYFKNSPSEFSYESSEIKEKIDLGDKKVSIVIDFEEPNSNLSKMIKQFMNCFKNKVELIKMSEFSIKGGCLGCIKCGYDNTCVYEGKDEFFDLFDQVKKADIIIYAGAIKDRYLSSQWKLFHDRNFFMNHSPTIKGKQIGHIISGPLSQNPNIREILHTYPEVEGANLVDFVSDESCNSNDIDVSLYNLAKGLIDNAHQKYIAPSTFRGVAGWKIFRDDIYGRLRIAFRADYKYYKENNVFKFPKLKLKDRVLITLTKMAGYQKIQNQMEKLSLLEFTRLNKKLKTKS